LYKETKEDSEGMEAWGAFKEMIFN